MGGLCQAIIIARETELLIEHLVETRETDKLPVHINLIINKVAEVILQEQMGIPARIEIQQVH